MTSPADSPPPADEENLIVVVRAPNQETQDFRVECPQTWNVLRLKEHLQQSYQGNPVPADQKLIYSGQLLDDNSVLREVLRQDGSCSQHTVHLVCRPPQGMNEGATTSRPRLASANQPLPQDNSRVLRPTGVAADDANELRYRGPMIQYEMASSRPDVYSAHVLALQSMYAQYYQQLIAHQQALMLGSNPASSIQYSFNPHAFQLGDQQQQQQLLAQMAAATAGFTQAHLNNNFVAGGQHQSNNNNNNNNNLNNNNNINNGNNNGNIQRANDEDGFGNANRDWLDVMYVAIRAAVFATFIYFYSSLERFVLVTGLGMLLYLYQQGLLGLPNVQVAPQPQVAPAVPVNVQPPQPPAPQQPPADRDGVDNHNRAAAAATAQQQQQREDIERLQAAMDGDDPRAMAGDAPPVAPASNVAPPQSPLAAAASLLRAFLVSLIPDNNNQQ